MAKVINFMPELQGEELRYVANIMKDMPDDEAEQFTSIYRARRREPMMILIGALAGLFILPGLQRFLVNQIGMGILYIFTLGLCFIGSIVDIITYQNLANEYNRKVAEDALELVRNNFNENVK